MAEQTRGTEFADKSELVAAFLFIHRQLTDVIHAICAAQGPEAFQNHAADALECLINPEARALAPLDHLLGLQIQEYIALFGPMTFVRAVVAEHDLGFIVEEYECLRDRREAQSPTHHRQEGVPNENKRPTTNSLVR